MQHESHQSLESTCRRIFQDIQDELFSFQGARIFQLRMALEAQNKMPLLSNLLDRTTGLPRKQVGTITFIDPDSIKDFSPASKNYINFAEILLNQGLSPFQYFESKMFVGLISAFELFMQDLIVAVVSFHPKKVGMVKFELNDILASQDNAELVVRAIEEILIKIMYKKPADYLEEVSQLLSIEREPLLSSWSQFVEAKARRDLGVHNNWKCNASYLRKIEKSISSKELMVGESMLPTDSYLDSTVEGVRSFV